MRSPLVALFCVLLLAACGSSSGPSDGGGPRLDGGALDGGSDGGGSDGGGSDGGGSDGGGSDGGNTDGGEACDAGVLPPAVVDAGPLILPACPAAGGDTVHGTRVDTYVTGNDDGGVITVPSDLSDSGLLALTLTDGGFCRLALAGAADGSFTISNVPAGSYYLHTATAVVVTSARDVDLGTVRLGRPDVVPSESFDTALSITATGLSPWQDDDLFEAFSSQAGTWGYALTAPGAGEVSMTSSPVPYEYFTPSNLIQASHGDRAYFTHLSTKVAGATGISYQALSESFTTSALEVVDGQTTALLGAFMAPAASGSITADWRRSEFAAYRTSVHPAASEDTADYTIYVTAIPGGLSRGYYDFGPDLFALDPFPFTSSTDVDLGTLSFKNPFPAPWGLVGSPYACWGVPHAFPGAEARTHSQCLGHDLDLATLSSAPLRPTLSPPRSLSVNGSSAYGNLAGVGTTPTLRWEAPALGSPNGYTVLVNRLFYDDSLCPPVTRRELHAYLVTKGTELTLPPGILHTGEYYFFVVRAHIAGAVDFEAQPLRTAFPSAIAPAISGRMTP